jgi:GAF domain-containing protein
VWWESQVAVLGLYRPADIIPVTLLLCRDGGEQRVWLGACPGAQERCVERPEPPRQHVSQTELERTLSVILQDALMLTGASLAFLYRADWASHRAVRVARVPAPTGSDVVAPDWIPIGAGIVGRCIAAGEVVHSDDMLADARTALPLLQRQAGRRSALCVPLIVDHSVIGALAVTHAEPARFTAVHAERLATFAQGVAATIERLWAWQDSSMSTSDNQRKQCRLHLRRVRELGALVHSQSDFDAVCDFALRAIVELTFAERALLALVDAEAGVIRGYRGLGTSPQMVAETVRPLFAQPSPDEDILAYVVRTREPAFTRLGDPRYHRETVERYGVSKYVLTVPLIGRSGVLGTLSAGWNHDASVEPDMLDLAHILADHVAVAIEMHRALEAERRQRLIAEELHVVAQRITAGLSLDSALAAVLRAVERLFGAASASFYPIDEHPRELSRRFTTRYTGEPHWDERNPPLAIWGPLADLLTAGQPYLIEDMPSHPLHRTIREEDTHTVAAVPARYNERLVGVLMANWRERRACRPSDLRLLEILAAYGAIALENARLHQYEVAAARLDGALLATRTAAHEINNDLSLTIAAAEYALEQARRGEPLALDLLQSIVESAGRAARHVQQLQNIVRLEERRFHDLPPLLDLERSSIP